MDDDFDRTLAWASFDIHVDRWYIWVGDSTAADVKDNRRNLQPGLYLA